MAESMRKVDVGKVLNIELRKTVQDGTHIDGLGRRRRGWYEAVSSAMGLKMLVSSSMKFESSERELTPANSTAETVVRRYREVEKIVCQNCLFRGPDINRSGLSNTVTGKRMGCNGGWLNVSRDAI